MKIVNWVWSLFFITKANRYQQQLDRFNNDIKRINCSYIYLPFFLSIYVIVRLLFCYPTQPKKFRYFYQSVCLKFPHVNFARFDINDLIKIPLQIFYLIFFTEQVQRRETDPVHRQKGKLEKAVSDIKQFLFLYVFQPFKKGFEVVGFHVFYKQESKKFQLLRVNWIRNTFFIIMVVLSAWVIMVPLEPMNQLIFSLILWAVALILRSTPGRIATLVMMVMSIIISSRYIWWRMTSSMNFDDTLSFVLGLGLLFAELYTWLILVMGYIQTAWPLKRQIVNLPKDTSKWPTVDLYIPTYNEPLKVIIPTVFASQNIDWPSDKLNIYVLDDGKREEIKRFCLEQGVNYLDRPDNSFAKAGNLNHAMTKTNGDFIAIFDCDHVPVRSFLQMTMGGFLQDEKLALVQTPHFFFSPDPFERNLDVFNSEPNEGELFYGQIQDGNDLWNATFFCGSCAVLRRTALQEVGGIATETVTEDAHTALKLHRLGYRSSYVNVKQAAGLATESISAHIGQRIRWARGMLQIFRVDNPLFGKGLSFMQRICYSNAMLHFFYGIPRLIFLTAPLAFLVFHAYIIYAPVEIIFLYVVPAIFHVNLTNSRHQGKHRNSFWAELYESVLAWYIFRPTLVALINPKKGKFNVTEKGGLVDKDYFDWGIGVPYLILIGLNILGLLFGAYRLIYGAELEQSTVWMNMIWVLYNLMILGGVMAVITESKQVRQAHRIDYMLPITVVDQNGYVYSAEMKDYSETGLGFKILDSDQTIRRNQILTIILQRDSIVKSFNVEVKFASQDFVGAEFENKSLENLKTLVQLTFSRADAWELKTIRRDQEIITSRLLSIFKIGLSGYRSFMYYLTKAIQTYLPFLYNIALYIGTLLPKKPIQLENT